MATAGSVCHLLENHGNSSQTCPAVSPATCHVLLSTEPPRWIKEPEGGVYSVGTNLVLLCEAIGNPEPTIQWKLNGMPIDSKYKVLQPSLGGGWIGCVCVVPLECTKSLMH